MSSIDDLIQKLCPDGVEYRTLGNVAEVVRGNGMPKTDLVDSGVGAIHYGQIYTHYAAWTNSTISFVSYEKASRLAKVDPGDLIVTNTSENIEDVCKAVAWLGRTQIVTGGHATVIKHHMNPKYLAYWFQSPELFKQKKKLATGTKVIDVSAKQLSKIRVPVPPLAVQAEIVRILDSFTSLEAELEAELEARKKQYEYYRSDLLKFGADVRRVDLKDVGTWYGGGTPSKQIASYWTHGTVPWISPKDMGAPNIYQTIDHVTETAVENSSTKLVPKGSIALVMRSSILEKSLPIAYLGVDATLNQDLRAVSTRANILPRFLFHSLNANARDILLTCRKHGGSVTSLDSSRFSSFKIPVPSLSVQHHIASVLDKFDALVNDLSSGLPAEIAARRKQYEYYRDRLLTFKELKA
jgi:type I restriction enzyme S subunit